MVIHNHTGLLLQCGAADSLASGIMELMESKALREQLNTNSKALAKDSFSVVAMVKGNVNIY